MRRFGVISAYPDRDWHSQQLVRAAARVGEVDVLDPTDFRLEVGPRGAALAARGQDVTRWDVWLTPRALGDAGDPDVQLTMYRALGDLGASVINPVAALLVAEDKIRCSWLLVRARVPTPWAVAAQTLAEAREALARMRVAVVKPPFGSLGQGIVKLTVSDRDAEAVLAGVLETHGVVYLQKYARPRRRGEDLRLFVVGDRVAAGLARIAPPGEFRSNIHLGGVPRPFEPDPTLAELAVRATRATGLIYAGVDVVLGASGPTVIEVNGAPRWEGILAATGRDMAVDIVAHAALLARRVGTREREERRERWSATRARAS